MVVPCGGVSGWVTVIPAGGLEIADPSSGDVIRDPRDITGHDTIRFLLVRDVAGGTNLRVRMAYDVDDGADEQGPQVRVIGGAGADPGTTPFVALRNRLGNRSVVLNKEPDDSIDANASGGEIAYTTPHNDVLTFDCDGCKYFLIGVEVKYKGQSGERAFLQAKIV